MRIDYAMYMAEVEHQFPDIRATILNDIVNDVVDQLLQNICRNIRKEEEGKTFSIDVDIDEITDLYHLKLTTNELNYILNQIQNEFNNINIGEMKMKRKEK